MFFGEVIRQDQTPPSVARAFSKPSATPRSMRPGKPDGGFEWEAFYSLWMSPHDLYLLVVARAAKVPLQNLGGKVPAASELRIANSELERCDVAHWLM